MKQKIVFLFRKEKSKFTCFSLKNFFFILFSIEISYKIET